jgi:hypothetical protein
MTEYWMTSKPVSISPVSLYFKNNLFFRKKWKGSIPSKVEGQGSPQKEQKKEA